LAVHMCIDSLHHWLLLQSASTLQPPAGSQVPSVLQAPERQTVPPSDIVHGPSPFARPQRVSLVSQTALAPALRPAAWVQVPSSVGLWPGSFGTGCPFGIFGTQVKLGSSQ